MKIEVDRSRLLQILECYVDEQDWGDYGTELEELCKDIFANNPELQKWREAREAMGGE